MPISTITKICPSCDTSFLASLAEHKRGGSIYCSRTCSGLARKIAPRRHKKPNAVCAFCQAPFYKRPSSLKNSKSGLFFCCREHKDLAQRIGGIEAIQPDHYGIGLNIDYRTLYFDRFNMPRVCERCSYSKIPEIVQVHHKDRDRTNNTRENLEALCPNCHSEEHFLTRTGLWTPKLGSQ